ncbi:hypothetical protein DENSPDRAFT_861070 [Dentipellis sp. KUC8613]|nr:hypothetical protein DENSPDRAFT_861070 [Dentipellis sp. KUC8613]
MAASTATPAATPAAGAGAGAPHEDLIIDEENNVLEDEEQDDSPEHEHAVSVPEETGEGGKLKMIVQLVKRCFGVKDIASMRLSLPASLLEPIPNLEYWHYLDRPDLFAAINDSEDPFERMLAVLRFTFSKDLRHIRGKVCKPYNSVLGEHFRAHWDIIPVSYSSDPNHPPIQHHHLLPGASTLSPPRPKSEAGSIRSGKKGGVGGLLSGWSTTALDRASDSPVESNASAQYSTLSLATTGGASTTSSPTPSSGGGDGAARVRVVYLTEQVSHHPPVSSFRAACPARHLALAGVDQIAAKVTSTAAVRIGAGEQNRGLFVTVAGGHGAGETYHATHPVAHVNGILRGNFYVTMGEATVVTCSREGASGEQLRAVVEYKEESWLGKPQFAVEGVVHTYDPARGEHAEWTRPKHVPRSRVRAEIAGSWRGLVRWRRAGAAEWHTLIDLGALAVVPKAVRAVERQEERESRRLWDAVTRRLVAKEYGEATRAKVTIEQRQREEAAERKKRGVEFIPRYFEKDASDGIPVLTKEGEQALAEELAEEAEFPLEAAPVPA